MMHKAWSSIVEVPYCFSRSYVKFQGHTALKIFEFDPNCAFLDCNSSLNSPMAMNCCTKLETAKERCTIVFQGHPSNFKVTRYKTSPILTQIGRFRTIGRSQLSNPSDLPCLWSDTNIQNGNRVLWTDPEKKTKKTKLNSFQHFKGLDFTTCWDHKYFHWSLIKTSICISIFSTLLSWHFTLGDIISMITACKTDVAMYCALYQYSVWISFRCHIWYIAVCHGLCVDDLHPTHPSLHIY